jgi:hypothetical protein
VLIETVSFDRKETREAMHVAWISGAPTAYALLRTGNKEAVAAARSVLDTVASGIAPCGAFWGEWRPDGWRAGWNGHPKKLHARTLAEASLFMARALAMEPGHPSWKKALRSNLDFAMKSMDETGHLGSYYHAESGEVLDRRGTAGLLWASALAEGSAIFGEKKYLDAAKKILAAYAKDIEKGELFGAPEDIHLCPSSEDTYNALLATMSVYENTGERKYLDLAEDAARWLLTYRFSYDAELPKGSTLEKQGFRTKGADIASPSNHHLHDYGLIVGRELAKLSEATGDSWYRDRAQDHLAAFIGQVSTRDVPGGPALGMMPEQLYTANWSNEGRAGEVGKQSHAWCLGLLVLGATDWLKDEERRT